MHYNLPFLSHHHSSYPGDFPVPLSPQLPSSTIKPASLLSSQQPSLLPFFFWHLFCSHLSFYFVDNLTTQLKFFFSVSHSNFPTKFQKWSGKYRAPCFGGLRTGESCEHSLVHWSSVSCPTCRTLGMCQYMSAGWLSPVSDPPNFLIVTFQKHQSDCISSLCEILHGFPIALEIKSNHLLESYKTRKLFPTCSPVPFRTVDAPPTIPLCLGDTNLRLNSHGPLPCKVFHWIPRQGGVAFLSSHCPWYIPIAQHLSQCIVIILLPVCHPQ